VALHGAGVDTREAAGGAARVGGITTGPAVGTVCATEAVDAAEATNAR
jgi:hypothetical protein